MASISFDSYVLSELSYKVNPNYNNDLKEIDVTPDLDFGINISKENSKIATKLNVTLGSLTEEDAGFMLTVNIFGIFSYDSEEIESYDIGFETFIKESTISILWSFIRPLVSDLILRGNKFPNYILPVINVAKLVKDNDVPITYE